METIKFFDEVENLKLQFNALQTVENCFVNNKTNEIIPVEKASRMDLSEYDFTPKLSDEVIDSIMQNRIQELFENFKENKSQSDEVSEFLKNNPDWFMDEPLIRKGDTVMGGIFNPLNIKVEEITRNYETKKIRVLFKILSSSINWSSNDIYKYMEGGYLIYEVTLPNYYTCGTKFEVGKTYSPSSICLDTPEYFTKEINGVTLYKFKQVRSVLLRMSGRNMRRK